MSDTIFLRDIARKAHLSGADFGATLREDVVALRGQRDMRALPLGLKLHTLDARAETDFTTQLTRPPAMVLHLVLEGVIDATVGGTPLALSRSAGAAVRLAYSATRTALPFLRRAREGDYLRKVNIVISWDWLAARDMSVETIMADAPLMQGSWLAQADEIAMGERLVALDRGDTQGGALEREALALTLAGRLLERISGLSGVGHLTLDERRRLERMEGHALRDGPLPSLDEIAQSGRMSVSSARRLFQKAHGQTVIARLRQLRMDRATTALRAGASVSEAARLAGYRSAESFSTAFKRQHHETPSRLRSGLTVKSGGFES
ncbi:MAG: helix-turn-helix transcriptional regulator [Thioclava marina]|uniref:helix-turn-helix transcriptional regulator n=1 Tax=Thioclava marina TaxID=1915077 RepID=UPI0019C9C2F8|nr:helix-turn-helix transcriptional regulator [Thioclava marina]MBC7145896.1 helix-turn-helix transcriptional regulator [Thioclava marina]